MDFYQPWVRKNPFPGSPKGGESPGGSLEGQQATWRGSVDISLTWPFWRRGAGSVGADVPCWRGHGHWGCSQQGPQEKERKGGQEIPADPTLCDDVEAWPRPATRQLQWENNFLLWSGPGRLPELQQEACDVHFGNVLVARNGMSNSCLMAVSVYVSFPRPRVQTGCLWGAVVSSRLSG